MAGKRIYDLTEASSLESTDFFAIDKSGQGNAQKLSASKLLTPMGNVSGAGDAYSSTTAYKVGDLVIHDDKLYECNTACAAAAWSTNAGYFTQVTLTDYCDRLKSSLNEELGFTGIATGLTTQITENGNYMALRGYKSTTRDGGKDSVLLAFNINSNKISLINYDASGNVVKRNDYVPQLTDTLSGTTDSVGCVSTGLSSSSYVVTAILVDSVLAIPLSINGTWYVSLRDRNTNQPIANSAVTYRIFYEPRI